MVTALTRFWADDKGLSIFSALLLVVAFVLPPLVPPGSGRSLAGDVVFALFLLISGSWPWPSEGWPGWCCCRPP